MSNSFSSNVYQFVLNYAAAMSLTFAEAGSKLRSKNKLTHKQLQTVDFSRPSVRAQEKKHGLLRMIKNSVNHMGGRRWLAQQVGCKVAKLEDESTEYKIRDHQLHVTAVYGVIERVRERIRCSVSTDLHETFDFVVRHDINSVIDKLEIDRVQWRYHHQFNEVIDGFIDIICNPQTDMEVVRQDHNVSSSDGKIYVHKFSPFSVVYDNQREVFKALEKSGKSNIPVSAKGNPTIVMGGSCLQCSLHTRQGLTHIAPCPRKDDPDHITGCALHGNDPSHGILTCPLVCNVTSRCALKNNGVDNYVEFYKKHPLKTTPNNGDYFRKPRSKKRPKHKHRKGDKNDSKKPE